MQIIILGMHRSGTSAVSRLINMMGAYLGPDQALMPPGPDNPKGYWERIDVQHLNDFVLKKSDASWRSVSKFDTNKIDYNSLQEFNRRASKIISEMDQKHPWVIKDPRMCLLLELWLPLLKSPICVHVFRHPIAVARSLEKRNQIPIGFGITLWEHYNICAITGSNRLPRFSINYENLMKKPDETIEEIYNALISRGSYPLSLSSKEKMLNFLESELQHYKNFEDDYTQYLSINQKDLWNLLKNNNLTKDYQFGDTSFQKSILNGYEELFSDIGKLHTQIHHQNTELTENKNKINKLESDVNRMFLLTDEIIQIFERLYYDVELILGSKTWKYGYLIAEIGRKIGILQKAPLAQDHVKNIFKHYQRWSKKHQSLLSEPEHSIDPLDNSNKSQDKTYNHANTNIDDEFNEEDYLIRYPDIQDAIDCGEFKSGLEHYQLIGKDEIKSGKRPYITPPYLKNNLIKNDGEIKKTQCENEIKKWEKKPIISIIMPVYNTGESWLEAAINSVKQQIYPYWELCIADDNSSLPETVSYLKNIDHSNIKIIFLDKNQGIASASNSALSIATGEYIAFLDHDDELTPDALYQIGKVINEHNPDLIYSDEDKISEQGHLLDPHYKPDYSPDLIFGINYICHLTTYRKDLLKKVGYFRSEFNGAQDYDLLLRYLDHTDQVFHIPKILYHWRKVPGSTATKFDNKHYAWEAGRLAIKDTLRRRNISGTVELGDSPGTYRVQRSLTDKPRISIIIPFQDKPDLLRQCIDSILKKTTYQDFEIVGISNNSQDSQTFALMDYYTNRDKHIRFLSYDIPFNFSKINNFAVQQCNSNHLVLLNNDTAVITPNWLEALLEHSQRSEVGAVGAKLYYPDDTIQHGGVILGIGGIAGHAHKYYSRGDTGYFNRLRLAQNLSAVTAACLMVKKHLYESIGGMDEENLPISFNDVDFCLRLREKGYLNVFTPYCELYHYESKTRGYEDTPEKQQRFAKEIAYMRKRHTDILRNGDPYYNINLPLDREDFGML